MNSKLCEQMKVRVTTQLHQWLKQQAKEQERSTNWFVNKLLIEAMRNKDEKQA